MPKTVKKKQISAPNAPPDIPPPENQEWNIENEEPDPSDYMIGTLFIVLGVIVFTIAARNYLNLHGGTFIDFAFWETGDKKWLEPLFWSFFTAVAWQITSAAISMGYRTYQKRHVFWGIGVNEGGSIYVENSIIAGNFTAGTGGGLWLSGEGAYQIVNSHIVGNKANGDGAALAGYYAQTLLTNSLVISNVGASGIGSQWGSTAIFVLNYCDTYGNSPDGTYGATITRNKCLGAPPVEGLDPMMVGGTLPSGVGPDYADQWLGYDYRLQPGSPAINAGTSIGAPTTDIDGTPRDAIPDIGAYEYLLHKYLYLPLVVK